jgi:hypothetical protein
MTPFSAKFSYTIIYELWSINSLGNAIPYDPSIFTFNPVSLTVSVQTNDLSKKGSYNLCIRGRYSFSMKYYYKDLQFSVVLQHPCVRNVISPLLNEMSKTKNEAVASQQFDRFEYEIGNPAKTFVIVPWQMSMSEALCG